MKENLKALREELALHLEDNILSYWVLNSIDMDNDGFIGQINGNNLKESDANKGAVLNARILWTFSIASRKLNEPLYRAMAVRSFEYLNKFFKDAENGGVYWELDSAGNPVSKRKQIYAQAFTIYALAEYYKINPEEEVLSWAVELFQLIEKYSFDPEYLGYIEAFDNDWSPLKDMRLSDKDINAEKTMNTHLHILEAYTNLYRIWPNAALKKSQESLIQLFLDKFINSDAHLNLFFNSKWELQGKTTSFGHDIECAWLLTEAAEIIGNDSLQLKTKQIAIRIANSFISEAIDIDGGIFNEKDELTGHIDTDKHWWPQAEALVGLMNTYTITGDEKYLDSLFAIWDFTKDYIIDHHHGEWFWKVDKTGIPDMNMEKIGFWKCPYHNSRACFEMIDRIEKQNLTN